LETFATPAAAATAAGRGGERRSYRILCLSTHVASFMEPVRTKAEVIARLQGQREQLRALGVAQLGLFGSFVRDEAGPDSDVDLLVDFQEGRKTFEGFFAVVDFLEELLGREVELLTRPGLSKYIGPHILKTTEYVLPAAA